MFSVLGKQCRLVIVYRRLHSRSLRCKLASRVPTAIFSNLRAVSGWMVKIWQAVFRSGPARFSAHARWEQIPNPEFALRASCAFLQKRFISIFHFLKSMKQISETNYQKPVFQTHRKTASGLLPLCKKPDLCVFIPVPIRSSFLRTQFRFPLDRDQQMLASPEWIPV